MNDPQTNGVPRNPLQPIVLWDGSLLYRMSEDDSDALVERWPNCSPSDDAFPPKKDDVGETPTEELLALMNAMCARKRERNLQYLLWHDVLDVLHDMGYRKVKVPASAEDTSKPGATAP